RPNEEVLTQVRPPVLSSLNTPGVVLAEGQK
ncbi:MAG: hypothetical protein FD130_2638, partial [Halothiobacillaceae bacterium]